MSPLTYSPEDVGHNDLAYYERREQIYVALDAHGPMPCAELAKVVGGNSHEIRAKLMSLRKDGLVNYDPLYGGEWEVEYE